MKYYCPICGYDGLVKPPTDYNICPCCGTEFGYDDVTHTWEELRDIWISRGAMWFSDQTLPPDNWSPVKQLSRFSRQRVSPRSELIEVLNLPMPFADDELLKAQSLIVKGTLDRQDDA